jgi:hypothetical protein
MDYDEVAHDDPWAPAQDGVPPVVGRKDPVTSKPLMRYDISGEVHKSNKNAVGGHEGRYQTDDGVDVSISF